MAFTQDVDPVQMGTAASGKPGVLASVGEGLGDIASILSQRKKPTGGGITPSEARVRAQFANQASAALDVDALIDATNVLSSGATEEAKKEAEALISRFGVTVKQRPNSKRGALTVLQAGLRGLKASYGQHVDQSEVDAHIKTQLGELPTQSLFEMKYREEEQAQKLAEERLKKQTELATAAIIKYEGDAPGLDLLPPRELIALAGPYLASEATWNATELVQKQSVADFYGDKGGFQSSLYADIDNIAFAVVRKYAGKTMSNEDMQQAQQDFVNGQEVMRQTMLQALKDANQRGASFDSTVIEDLDQRIKDNTELMNQGLFSGDASALQGTLNYMKVLEANAIQSSTALAASKLAHDLYGNSMYGKTMIETVQKMLSATGHSQNRLAKDLISFTNTQNVSGTKIAETSEEQVLRTMKNFETFAANGLELSSLSSEDDRHIRDIGMELLRNSVKNQTPILTEYDRGSFEAASYLAAIEAEEPNSLQSQYSSKGGFSRQVYLESISSSYYHKNLMALPDSFKKRRIMRLNRNHLSQEIAEEVKALRGYTPILNNNGKLVINDETGAIEYHRVKGTGGKIGRFDVDVFKNIETESEAANDRQIQLGLDKLNRIGEMIHDMDQQLGTKRVSSDLEPTRANTLKHIFSQGFADPSTGRLKGVQTKESADLSFEQKESITIRGLKTVVDVIVNKGKSINKDILEDDALVVFLKENAINFYNWAQDATPWTDPDVVSGEKSIVDKWREAMSASPLERKIAEREIFNLNEFLAKQPVGIMVENLKDKEPKE